MFIWHEHAHNPAPSAASFRLVLSGIAKGRGPGCSLMDSLIRKTMAEASRILAAARRASGSPRSRWHPRHPGFGGRADRPDIHPGGERPGASARRSPPQRPACVAGHVRFELRNVVANYPFERSRRFEAIQPNFGHGDRSRLSCGVGDTQLGAGFCRDLHGRWPSWGLAEKARIGRDLFRSEDDPPAAKPATPLLSLRWTLSAHGACVWTRTPSLNGSRLSPARAPWASAGLRWWRRAVAPPPARCCAELWLPFVGVLNATRSVATLRGDRNNA